MSSAHRRGRSDLQDVRINPVPTNGSSAGSSSSSSTSSIPFYRRTAFSKHFEWVHNNWNWFSIKPIIRCSLAACVSVILFAIPAVERWMGIASFLILIASFFSPPFDPFVSVLERELLILIFVCLAWAWSCLGLKFASLARSEIIYDVTSVEVFSGRYIESGPSVIVGVFIAIGSYFFLFVKARGGAGPYLFACLFGCISLDITLTSAVLYPYPNYMIGLSIFLPLSLHSAVSLFASLLIFPLSVTTQFTERLQAFFDPLSTLLLQHATLLQSPVDTPEFDSLVESVVATYKKQEGVLVSLAAAGRLRSSDLTLNRFSPRDFDAFHGFARRLTGRLHGMSMYFRLINPEMDKYPGTPIVSAAPTPSPGTPISQSRQTSPERSGASTPAPRFSPTSPKLMSRTASGQSLHHHHHHHHLHHHILHNSLLNIALKPRHRRAEKVVGVFESQKYLNLEARHLRDPRHDEWVQLETDLLGKGCTPLLEACSEGLNTTARWFESIRKGKWNIFHRRKQQQDRERTLDRIMTVRASLAEALKTFREVGRLRVIEPYYPAVDLSPVDEEAHHGEIPPHRHLFHCYVYQYHLIQVASVTLEIMDEIIRLENERTTLKLYTPVTQLFRLNAHDLTENADHDDDDDPDIIQGAHEPAYNEDLGLPHRRDPDALPPRNVFEVVMNLVYHAGSALFQGNSLFAIKAAIVTTALCLPFLIKSTASYAYNKRYVWAIIMGQLTLARFRGDTTFGLAARIGATFVGGLIGMVMWYISAGSGRSSPYAFVTVCAVCMPAFYMVRLYAPLPAMTRMVAFVTAILVLGYSYQDTHQVIPNSPGHGWEVAWRRFVLVTIGVVAAFLSSLLPPTMTLRRYQRSLLSTTCTELGSIYCSIVSFASEKREEGIQEIISTILATRSKLNRSAGLSTNIVYEFSLRGRWPKKRYQQILDLQIAMTHSLAHLLSVVEHLEPSWTRALLRRSRFLDPDFQGDVLAVFAMISSSLRTGNPLPQVTPCPLLDRFMMRYHGLDVIHRDAEEDYGLPRLLTLDTLQNEQYMMFCVGISTAYALINRLDRLMLATKEIVGEQFHIHGVVPRGLKRQETGLEDAERVAEAAAQEVGMTSEGGGGGMSGGLYPLSPSVSRAVSEMQLKRGRERERKEKEV